MLFTILLEIFWINVFLKSKKSADFFDFKKTFIQKISNKIVNSIRGINRVVYDVTSKPPSTIELEWTRLKR